MLLTIGKPLALVWYRTKVPECSILQSGHCIKVATVEQQQRTDRLDISNSVDSAGEFRLVAAATTDIYFCSRFLIWHLKPQWENWLQKCLIFSYFVHTLQQKVRTFFIYIWGKMPFFAVQFTVPVFLCFTFHKTLEFQGRKSGGLAIDEPSRGSMNIPVDHSHICLFCYRLPPLYKLFRLFFEYSDSMSVFTSYSVIMWNWYRVSSENLVVMQAHWGINFQFLFNNADSGYMRKFLRMKIWK